MFGLVIINILLRYIFNINFIFLQELVMYLHAFIFLFGVSICLRDDSHVRIDVVTNKLRKKNKIIIDLIGYIVLVIPFCFFVIYESTTMISQSWSMLEGSSEPGGLPIVYILKSSIYIFSLLLLIQTIGKISRNI
ncbi:MAG: TRAP transporter small permease subunit [Pseudomonadota bacterium]|nr:TRAP transporter small permease subunit [Pseudomonadota bacterium]